MNIETRVLRIVEELTEIEDLTSGQLLLDEGILDSLTTIELITKLEEDFGIDIDTDDMSHHNFNSIENITELVLNKTNK